MKRLRAELSPSWKLNTIFRYHKRDLFMLYNYSINYISVLIIVSTFSPLLPLIVGVRKSLSLIWIYILIGLVSNILISIIFISPINENNKWIISNVYIWIEMAFIWLYFLERFGERYEWIIYTAFYLTLISVINTLFNSNGQFNGISAAILALTYMGFCVTDLYTIMNDKQITNLYLSSKFFITTGFLLYFSSNFMLFTVTNYFGEPLSDKARLLTGTLWIINSVANVIQSIIFTKAFDLDNPAIKAYGKNGLYTKIKIAHGT